MFNNTFRATLALLAIGFTHTAFATTWSTYKNPRFGYEVMVPEILRNTNPIIDEDGRTFESEDGTAKLEAFGFLDEHTYGSELYLEKVLRPSGVLENGTEVQVNDYSLALKKHENDLTIFEKMLFTCKDKVVNVIRFTYKTELEDIYAPLAEKLDRRFSGGLGSQTPICM